MKDKEFAKEFAELNAGKDFIFNGKYKVRLIGYKENTCFLLVSGHPYGWCTFSRPEGAVLLVWADVMHDKLYYVKPDDLVLCPKPNKEFAEKHAGENFLFKNQTRVRLVGYRAESNTLVLVSLPNYVCTFGWSGYMLDAGDVFTIPSDTDRFWYVEVEQLKKQII